MITDKISQNNPIYLQSDTRTLIVGVSGTLRIYKDQDTSQEPQNVPTLKEMNSLDLHPNGKQVLVSGGVECGIHDINVIVEGKGEASDLPPMNSLQKSTFRIMDAVFTHDGNRVLIGNLGAKLTQLDLNDSGKEINSINIEGEIVGLAYNKLLDYVAVTTADGNCFIYKFNANGDLEKRASLGALFVDKRIILTEDLLPEDSDFSDDDDDDDDSLISGTTDSYDTAQAAKRNKKLLKFTASRAAWSSNGDLLAVPTKDKKIHVYKTDQWTSPLYILDGGISSHKEYFTCLAFSFDGTKLVSLGLDKKLIFWDTITRKLIARESLDYIGYRIVWTSSNSLTVGSISSELSTIDSRSLNTLLTANKELEEGDEDEEKEEEKNANPKVNNRDEGLFGDEDDSGDDVNMDDEDDADLDRPQSQDYDGFIVDDNESDKRVRDDGSESTALTDNRNNKRQKLNAYTTEPFRPGNGANVNISKLRPYSTGATPWHGNRRYLTICQTGFSYSVKGDTNSSPFKVTVNFFDTSNTRDYHFDDLNGFDLCAMDLHGALFATSGYKKRKGFEAVITYKTHSLIGAETSWSRTFKLRPNEFITSISVNEDMCFICTSTGFVRKFTIYGRLIDMWMTDPIICVMNNDKYVFTVVQKGNDNYWFNIQNQRGKYLQQCCSVPLMCHLDGPIKNMFFSRDGDPCIVRNDNIMIVLSDWRKNSTPIWKPLLDIEDGVRRKGRGEELKAWPLALNDDEFMFIPYRGTKYPIFPLLSPMVVDILIPFTYNSDKKRKDKSHNSGNDNADEDSEQDEDGEEEEEDAEEQYLRYKTLSELLTDGVSNDDIRDETAEDRLQQFKINTQKALLLLFSNAIEEDSNEDAYSLASLMEPNSLEYAQRIAHRQNMVTLVDQIVRLREALEISDV